MENRPAKTAFDEARARGLKGIALLPLRRAMSAEAAKLHALQKCAVITDNIKKLQDSVKEMQALGIPGPYLIRIRERGRERPIDVRDLVRNLTAQLAREMKKIKP